MNKTLSGNPIFTIRGGLSPAVKTLVKIGLAFLILICCVELTNLVARAQTSGESRPRLISNPDLEFPNEAYMGRVVGTVWLRILVGRDGTPIKTDIAKRDPEMAYLFDNTARKWGMRCKFIPASNGTGDSVQAWATIPLSFALDPITPAACISQAEPEYPAEAREMGMEGWVGLAVLVKSNGEVDMSQIIVVAREPENTSIFEEAAKRAAYHSRYRAAGFEHTAAEGWCFIKVTFKLEEPKGK